SEVRAKGTFRNHPLLRATKLLRETSTTRQRPIGSIGLVWFVTETTVKYQTQVKRFEFVVFQIRILVQCPALVQFQRPFQAMLEKGIILREVLGIASSQMLEFGSEDRPFSFSTYLATDTQTIRDRVTSLSIKP